MRRHDFSTRLLDGIERAGNRLPHPTLLFLYLCLLVIAVSALAEWLGAATRHPLSGESLVARSLFSGEGLHWWLQNAVTNFTGFAPVGTVLVAMLGIGIADRSGLLSCALRLLVTRAPAWSLSFTVVLAGCLSSLAADAGYVVLIPLAALLFQAAGRHPLAGIACAFAGVSGGFSANFMIGPIDAVLAGISTEAAHLVDPAYQVSAAGNWYMLAASTVLISLIGAWITERVVCPRLGISDASSTKTGVDTLSTGERRGLRAVAAFSVVFAALLLAAALPAEGLLRGRPGEASLLLQGVVVVIAVYAAIAGWIHGRCSGRFRHGQDAVEAMEHSMGTMATYLVLMFFAAQFVNAFAWTGLGTITAVAGASWLAGMEPGPLGLLLALVLISGAANLLLGSASAKWALLAPVLVPMLYLLGVSPEATQMAYRIGDSVTNIITPLMPYFGVVVAFAQRHQRDTGIGTLIALMLPYSLAFAIAWCLLLVVWVQLGWPLGPGASVTLGS